MKEVKYYACEMCGTIYTEKEHAINCENNHKKIKQIDSCIYNAYKNDNTGLPSRITVEFDNGEKVDFSRF